MTSKAGSYFDRCRCSETHLETTIAYVENNPVTAGLATPDGWRRSFGVFDRMRLEIKTMSGRDARGSRSMIMSGLGAGYRAVDARGFQKTMSLVPDIPCSTASVPCSSSLLWLTRRSKNTG
jgi:hypothetical protein